jgi:eukaryotic-like serine/threonine-protein kinase
MTNSSSAHDERDDRLEQVLAEYLRSVESGAALDRQALVNKHPDLADDLRSFFANRDALDRVADPLKAFAFEPTMGTDSSTDDSPRVRYVGDYELLAEIARGGMGVVYRARQVSLNRIVAVKMILSGGLAGPEDLGRFRAEAEAAARLEHPHVVPIHEIGEHNGQPYFSMAFIPGESLAQRIMREVVAPKEAAEIMLKVARAIAYAHAQGVAHRDLKPANILIDRAGESHITDFGLAKLFSTPDAAASAERQQLTNTGQVLGTPSYMAPEQASGRTKEMGPATDIYALDPGASCWSRRTCLAVDPKATPQRRPHCGRCCRHAVADRPGVRKLALVPGVATRTADAQD